MWADLHNPSETAFLERNWKNYNPLLLNKILVDCEWSIDCDNVQSLWNRFENGLVMIVDQIVPYVTFVNNLQTQNNYPLQSKTKSIKEHVY